MLEATGLVKRYGRVTALDGFTLSVAPGEITGLVGHNGAGKTTFTRIVAGLAAPDVGHVTIAGLAPRRAARLSAWHRRRSRFIRPSPCGSRCACLVVCMGCGANGSRPRSAG